MSRMFIGVFLISVASAGAVQSKQYLSTGGSWFSFEENQHGAVLKSIEQSTGVAAPNANDPQINVGDILYLGRSCDAFSTDFGEGSWKWTNSGFIVEFPAGRITFPGQVIDIAQENQCRK